MKRLNIVFVLLCIISTASSCSLQRSNEQVELKSKLLAEANTELSKAIAVLDSATQQGQSTRIAQAVTSAQEAVTTMETRHRALMHSLAALQNADSHYKLSRNTWNVTVHSSALALTARKKLATTVTQ